MLEAVVTFLSKIWFLIVAGVAALAYIFGMKKDIALLKQELSEVRRLVSSNKEEFRENDKRQMENLVTMQSDIKNIFMLLGGKIDG